MLRKSAQIATLVAILELEGSSRSRLTVRRHGSAIAPRRARARRAWVTRTPGGSTAIAHQGPAPQRVGRRGARPLAGLGVADRARLLRVPGPQQGAARGHLPGGGARPAGPGLSG